MALKFKLINIQSCSQSMVVPCSTAFSARAQSLTGRRSQSICDCRRQWLPQAASLTSVLLSLLALALLFTGVNAHGGQIYCVRSQVSSSHARTKVGSFAPVGVKGVTTYYLFRAHDETGFFYAGLNLTGIPTPCPAASITFSVGISTSTSTFVDSVNTADTKGSVSWKKKKFGGTWSLTAFFAFYSTKVKVDEWENQLLADAVLPQPTVAVSCDFPVGNRITLATAYFETALNTCTDAPVPFPVSLD